MIAEPSRHLYLSTNSFLPSGYRLFLIPSNVLLTASDAPIMGLSTAMGTARTTALSGPYVAHRSAQYRKRQHKTPHVIPRPLVHLHWYCQNRLGRRIDIP